MRAADMVKHKCGASDNSFFIRENIVASYRIGFYAMTRNDLIEMLRIRKHFDDLQGLFQRYLPNVDPDLIYDLLTRLRENPDIIPTYTLEIYTR